LNLNKTVRFDHLTDEGRLNKFYTILLLVSYFIIFLLTLSIFPEDTTNINYGMSTFLSWMCLIIELCVVIMCVTMCWSTNWGKRYIEMREKYTKKYEKD